MHYQKKKKKKEVLPRNEPFVILGIDTLLSKNLNIHERKKKQISFI